MPDEGVDIGYCDECGRFGEVVYGDAPWPTKAGQYNQIAYCKLHIPIKLHSDDLDLIFEKAGVEGPRRHRLMESIMGVLFFSKKHHAQAKRELGI